MKPLVRLFEEADCLVIDKPAGLPVVGTATASPELTVEQQLPGWHAVHRLDNETSGCLLLARSEALAVQLRAALQRGEIRKTYHAIVYGLTPATLIVDHPIAHHATKRNRMIAATTGAAHRGHPQTAHSELTTLRRLPPTPTRPLPVSHVAVQITTGVRHQIRVHLATVGYPIVGDKLYGGRRTAAHFTTTRHLLHASRLEFSHPTDGEPITVEAPLPADFVRIIDM